MTDINETYTDELRDEAQLLEPQCTLIPNWVAQNFEAQGGVLIGKVEHRDGWVSFTGIERFTDACLADLERALFGSQLSAA